MSLSKGYFGQIKPHQKIPFPFLSIHFLSKLISGLGDCHPQELGNKNFNIKEMFCLFNLNLRTTRDSAIFKKIYQNVQLNEPSIPIGRTLPIIIC